MLNDKDIITYKWMLDAFFKAYPNTINDTVLYEGNKVTLLEIATKNTLDEDVIKILAKPLASSSEPSSSSESYSLASFNLDDISYNYTSDIDGIQSAIGYNDFQPALDIIANNLTLITKIGTNGDTLIHTIVRGSETEDSIEFLECILDTMEKENFEKKINKPTKIEKMTALYMAAKEKPHFYNLLIKHGADKQIALDEACERFKTFKEWQKDKLIQQKIDQEMLKLWQRISNSYQQIIVLLSSDNTNLASSSSSSI